METKLQECNFESEFFDRISDNLKRTSLYENFKYSHPLNEYTLNFVTTCRSHLLRAERTAFILSQTSEK